MLASRANNLGMENKVMGWCILIFGMLGFAASVIASSNDIPCMQALINLFPCQSYLNGSGPATPSRGCCLGVQKALGEVKSIPIRRNICECFKKVAKAYGVDTSRAHSIPQYCHVSLPAPLDPNIDCSTIPS